METEVTDIIESAVNTVPGIEEMRSTSSRGSSNVTITFNLEKNPIRLFRSSSRRFRRSSIAPGKRRSAHRAKKRSRFTAHSAVLDQRAAQRHRAHEHGRKPDSGADRIGGRRRRGISYGARQRQIKIFVNPDRLRAYNLSVTEVTNAVRSQNQELPGGNLIEGAKTLGLRTMSKLTEVEQFNDIVITTRNNFPIKIRDIGRVEEGGADPSSAASLDGVQSVSLAVRKQSGANTIAVIKEVKARMAEIIPNLPSDMKVAVIRDQSEFIENSCTRSRNT
jgi:HAE1 family hydrophobic/amphiphilic exporter-1